MRVVLSNLGSFGDVNVILALAVALRARGHDVAVGTSPEYATLVASHDVTWRQVGPALSSCDAEAVIARMCRETNPGVQMRLFMEPFVEHGPSILRDLEAMCEGADLLVCGATQPAGELVHERLGIPLARVLNAIIGPRGSRAMEAALADASRLIRRRCGLREQAAADGVETAPLVLVALSPGLFGSGDTWPTGYHMTGFLSLGPPPRWQPADALRAFVQDGEPPVCVAFGSFAPMTPPHVLDAILQACRSAKRRVLIQVAGLDEPVRASEDVLMIGYVPHEWLFPRCSWILTHGGAGTTAALFRAGVPGIFVPHVLDQPLWARLAAELGCAPEPLAIECVDHAALVPHLTRIMRDDRFQAPARRVRETLAGEQSHTIACDRLAWHAGTPVIAPRQAG